MAGTGCPQWGEKAREKAHWKDAVEAKDREFRALDLAQRLLCGFALFSKSGCPTAPFTSARAFLLHLADEHLVHLQTQRNLADNREDARKRFIARHRFKKLVSHYCLDDTGPFKPYCDDLQPSNMLADPETLRITAVLDFEFSNIMPSQFAYDPPWWLLLLGPDMWLERHSMDEFTNRYVPRLEQFLRALERVEARTNSEQPPHGPRLSARMCDSWASKRFWFDYGIRKSFDIDAVYWNALHENEDDVLDDEMTEEMEKLMDMKMEQLKAYDAEFMSTGPQLHSQFNVTSGSVCYGALHNIYYGASIPVQAFSTSISRNTGGTVVYQHIGYNIAAQNGTWKAYQLVRKGTDDVCAWFVAHSDVDPEAEVRRILRVSGSPYEPDSGSRLNDEKTAAEGVFVINRYDWGWYDKRGKDNVADADEPPPDTMPNPIHEAAGLVDYKGAMEEVSRWQKQKSHEREASQNGVWMDIPGGEYMFGRFGFNEDRTAARSFLFFTTYTVFTRTTFVGQDRTLLVEETGEERFERQLREGRNFEGLDDIETFTSFWNNRPAESEYLGPYKVEEHILHNKDLDAIRFRPGIKANDFPEQWREKGHALLNEMVMTYLVRFIAPASSCDTVVEAATALFEGSDNSNMFDGCMYSSMTKPFSDPIDGYDSRQVGQRIRKFLTPYCDDVSLIRDDNFVNGVCACIGYLLSEVFEQAKTWGTDSGRNKLVPTDVRHSVLLDTDLRDVLTYSNYFWKGTGPTSHAVESSQAVEASQAAESSNVTESARAAD